MSITATFALSGANTANMRLQIVARNVANSRAPDTNQQPVGITAIRQGVTVAQTNSPALSPAYTPTGPNGDARAFATSPYTRLTNEMVRQLVARFDLTARAHVAHVDQQMSAGLLNRLAGAAATRR
jgi:flagellar basal body rod protein FlgC